MTDDDQLKGFSYKGVSVKARRAKMDAVMNGLAGGSSAAVAVALLNPLDTLKTRWQTRSVRLYSYECMLVSHIADAPCSGRRTRL